LKPGERAQLVFAFLPMSHVFKTGHRIRISVAGSDYRERDRTPISPAPVVTIYNTPSHPSYISLPLIHPKGTIR
jgi:predicted acyl esterase